MTRFGSVLVLAGALVVLGHARPAAAQTTVVVDGKLHVTAGSSPEEWQAGHVQTGSTDRTVYGKLHITADAPPLLVNGDPCTNGTECLSGFCTDGVCCGTACSGGCESCGPGGICSTAPAGAVCRALAGTCDVTEETCDGVSGACPDDVVVAAGTPCDPLGNTCDGVTGGCGGGGGTGNNPLLCLP